MVMPTPTVYAALNLFLALVVGTTLVHGEYGSANSDDKDQYVLPQRLVRREFLRFGKRSGEQEEETLGMESEPNFEGLPEGMSEIYDGNSLQDDIVHEAKQRSFLRFGKRSENYIRFGKKADFDHQPIILPGKKSENYLRFGKRFWPHYHQIQYHSAIPVQAKKRNNEEEPNNTGQFDGISEIQPESLNKKKSGGEPHGCTSFGDGYFVICRVDYGNKRNNRYKKARDFLRFG